MDLDKVLDDADLPTKRVTMCLKGSLRAEWDAAQEVLADLQQQVIAATNQDGKVTAAASLLRDRRIAAENVQAVETRMAEQSVTFTFVGKSFAAYNALLVKHPPREGVRGDELWGFNADTFHVANVRACLSEPAVDDAQWDRLVGVLTDAQWDQLAGAALAVNRTERGEVPFSRSASNVINDSAATSPPPEPWA